MKNLDIARLQGLVFEALRIAKDYPDSSASGAHGRVVDWLGKAEALTQEQLQWLLVALPEGGDSSTIGQLQRGVVAHLVVCRGRGVEGLHVHSKRKGIRMARWARVWWRRNEAGEKLRSWRLSCLDSHWERSRTSYGGSLTSSFTDPSSPCASK